MSEQPLQERQPTEEEIKYSFFEYLRQNTVIYPSSSYEKAFAPAREHFGINSPAVIIPKAKIADHPYKDILPSKLSGNFLIAIDGQSVPDPDYIAFLITHEYEELFVTNKPGKNMAKYTHKDYQLPILEQRRPAHRYATLKEFEIAAEYGKLDKYMDWWREFYEQDILTIEKLEDEEIERISKNYDPEGGSREMIIKFIRKNLELKESIYKKVKKKSNNLS